MWENYSEVIQTCSKNFTNGIKYGNLLYFEEFSINLNINWKSVIKSIIGYFEAS